MILEVAPPEGVGPIGIGMTMDDEGGRSYVAPSLLLALWRPFVEDEDPGEEQGHYFQSVLVAQPGY